MEDANIPMEKVYNIKNELIILGLTGKTGSGCSTTANILKKEKATDLDLKSICTQGALSAEDRKYSVYKKFMEFDNHWQGFSVIEEGDFYYCHEYACRKL